MFDAIGKLRAIYHHLMKLDYDNKRTRSSSEITADLAVEEKTPIQLFSDFYELQNNQPLSEEQATFLNGLIETIWEEGHCETKSTDYLCFRTLR